MSTKWNKMKLAGVLFVFCIITFIGRSDHAKAAETLELNATYMIQINDGETRLYQFTVPTAGNVHVQLKNTDPVGQEQIGAQLFDSNNLELTKRRTGVNVDMPIYSTDGNRTFYLKVWDNYYAEKTSFYLTVEFQETADWETEENNSTESADTIMANRIWYGMINDTNDSCDYFRFTLTANKKIQITFGPATVDGEDHGWYVSLLDSKNNSVKIYSDKVTQTYNCYLQKGTYYIKVERNYYSENITYALSYSESSFSIKKPQITSVKGTAHKNFFSSNYMDFDTIKIKNSGECTGYTVKVAKKKSMKGKMVQKDIDFGETNSKKKISLGERLNVLKKYYIQVRGYVKDPFGNGIYGKYGKVKCKKLKNSLYKEFKN